MTTASLILDSHRVRFGVDIFYALKMISADENTKNAFNLFLFSMAQSRRLSY
jgi:hypothetical protein